MNALPLPYASYAASRRGLKIITEKENKTALRNSYWNNKPFKFHGVCSFSLGRSCHLMKEVGFSLSFYLHCKGKKKKNHLKDFANRSMWDLSCTSGDLAAIFLQGLRLTCPPVKAWMQLWLSWRTSPSFPLIGDVLFGHPVLQTF